MNTWSARQATNTNRAAWNTPHTQMWCDAS